MNIIKKKLFPLLNIKKRSVSNILYVLAYYMHPVDF